MGTALLIILILAIMCWSMLGKLSRLGKENTRLLDEVNRLRCLDRRGHDVESE